jgi:hypothetical protein
MTTPALRAAARLVAVMLCGIVLASTAACRRAEAPTPHRTFASPEEAVAALAEAVERGKLEEVSNIFGPGSQALIDSSDPETARRNRAVFAVAYAERWRLESPDAATRTLVIGNEEWPFPIPIAREGERWRFDTEAGVEEILARRIGRNELSVIRICRTYVAAQRLYAQRGHDGRSAGLYAAAFRSEPGKHNGLYWPAARGERRSPLGDLVAAAAAEGRAVGGDGAQPAPFHGYYFRILTAQGPAAPGGARDYLQGGELSGGFALIAWPAHYDVTGVMTFVVNQDGLVHEKDLGADTDAAARAMTAYDPDATWSVVR